MATEEEIVKLAESLKANGLAASDTDAIAMAEKILGKSETPEQRFEKSTEDVKPETKEAGVADVEKELEKIESKKESEPATEQSAGEQKAEEEPVKVEDIEPVEKKEGYDVTKENKTVKELAEKGEELEKKDEEETEGFKEIPVEKGKKKPGLTEEEKESTDLSKWFYYGKK